MSERSVIRSARLVGGAVLAVVVVAAVAALLLARGVPLTGRQTLVIDGRSMEPTIPIGSAVVLAPVSAEDLRAGDVVSLRSGPQRAVFTHRIVRIVDEAGTPMIETKGDANGHPDPSLTPASAVLGRVEWSLPILGFLLAYLSLPSGTIFVLCLGVTLIAALALLDDLDVGVADERELGRRLPVVTEG